MVLFYGYSLVLCNRKHMFGILLTEDNKLWQAVKSSRKSEIVLEQKSKLSVRELLEWKWKEFYQNATWVEVEIKYTWVKAKK